MSNFGNLCRDNIAGNLQIKGKMVIDSKANINANHINGRTLRLGGKLCLDRNCNLVDNGDANQVKYPKGYICDFKMVCLDESTIGITAGACRDANDSCNICGEGFTIDMYVSGAGGLDTGVPPAIGQGADLYAVYVIADSSGTNPISGVVSLALEEPNLPDGYDKYRLVGYARWKRFDASLSPVGPRWTPFIQKGSGKDRHMCYDDLQLKQIVLQDDADDLEDWTTIYMGPTGFNPSPPPFLPANLVPPGQCKVDLKVQFNQFEEDYPSTTRLMIRPTGSKSTLSTPGNPPSGTEIMFASPHVVWMTRGDWEDNAPGPVASQEITVCTNEYGEIDIVAYTGPGPSTNGVVQIVVLGYSYEL